jgi:ABC-type dipeptide/oligopeptide/nickel transport system permease component
MARLIGRRLLLMVPTLILVSILVFAWPRCCPATWGAPSWGPTPPSRQVDQLDHSWA